MKNQSQRNGNVLENSYKIEYGKKVILNKLFNVFEKKKGCQKIRNYRNAQYSTLISGLLNL
jgi:hypothetical protein